MNYTLDTCPLGPLQVSFGRMLSDIARFVVLFLLVRLTSGIQLNLSSSTTSRMSENPLETTNRIDAVSRGGALGLSPQTLDHGQYFASILLKLHEIW